MSTYKNFLLAARTYFNSSPFLRGLTSAHLVVFGLGGAVYLLGAFLINLQALSAFSLYDALTSIGAVLAFIGLALTVLSDDAMGMLIVSSVISLGALVAWIVIVAGGYIPFMFEPLFFFLLFGTAVLLTAIKADRFKQMRAAAAARAQVAVVPCPKCGAFIPMNMAYCPDCGTQNPAMQYAPPMQYQAPQYAAPLPQAAPMQPQAQKCASCGADIEPGTVFCPKCGIKL